MKYLQRVRLTIAGQGVQGAMNKTQGVELEIRKDDGSTIMVVQKQGNTRFSAGQRVVLASNGSHVRGKRDGPQPGGGVQNMTKALHQQGL